MAWEIIINEGKTVEDRPKDSNWVYFPGTKCKINKNGGRYASLTFSKPVLDELRWQPGDRLLCMIDRETKLLAVTRDKKGPTVLSRSHTKKNKDGSTAGRSRLNLQRDLTFALQTMWGVSQKEDSESVILEYIIDGAMVVFSKRPQND